MKIFTLNEIELQELIDLKAKSLAKAELKILMDNKDKSKNRKNNIYHNLSARELSGRKAEVYNIIKLHPDLDRHGVREAFESFYDRSVSPSSICARMSELEASGLIFAASISKSRYGKPIGNYRISQKEQ